MQKIVFLVAVVLAIFFGAGLFLAELFFPDETEPEGSETVGGTAPRDVTDAKAGPALPEAFLTINKAWPPLDAHNRDAPPPPASIFSTPAGRQLLKRRAPPAPAEPTQPPLPGESIPYDKDGAFAPPDEMDGVAGGKVVFAKGVFPIPANKRVTDVQRFLGLTRPIVCGTCGGTRTVTKKAIVGWRRQATMYYAPVTRTWSETCPDCSGQGDVFPPKAAEQFLRLVETLAHVTPGTQFDSVHSASGARLSRLSDPRVGRHFGPLWEKARSQQPAGQPVVLMGGVRSAAGPGWPVKWYTLAVQLGGGQAIIVCDSLHHSLPAGRAVVGGLVVGTWTSRRGRHSLPVVFGVVSAKP